MSDAPAFGVKEGLGRRLNTWANQLSRDKSYPWVGTGLIADIKKAAEELGAPPFDEMFPLVVQITPPKPAILEPVTPDDYVDEFAEFYAMKVATVEFDL